MSTSLATLQAALVALGIMAQPTAPVPRWPPGQPIPVHLYVAEEWQPVVATALASWQALGWPLAIATYGEPQATCPWHDQGITICTAHLPDAWQGVATPTLDECPSCTAVRITLNTRHYLGVTDLNWPQVLALVQHELGHALGYTHQAINEEGMPRGSTDPAVRDD